MNIDFVHDTGPMRNNVGGIIDGHLWRAMLDGREVGSISFDTIDPLRFFDVWASPLVSQWPSNARCIGECRNLNEAQRMIADWFGG
jgi:hypothetical protein